MPQGLKIVCSIILQGSRLRRTGGTPNDTDVVNGLHTIFETGLKVFALGTFFKRINECPFLYCQSYGRIAYKSYGIICTRK